MHLSSLCGLACLHVDVLHSLAAIVAEQVLDVLMLELGASQQPVQLAPCIHEVVLITARQPVQLARLGSW